MYRLRIYGHDYSVFVRPGKDGIRDGWCWFLYRHNQLIDHGEYVFSTKLTALAEAGTMAVGHAVSQAQENE